MKKRGEEKWVEKKKRRRRSKGRRKRKREGGGGGREGELTQKEEKEKGRIEEKDDKKMLRCCVYTCIPFQFLDQQILSMADKSAGSNKNVIPNAPPYHCQSCN